MGLPETIRVKISPEGAESIALAPVVVQDLALEELIQMMLGVTGKNVARIGELLQRGSLVSGASRFRWQGFQAEGSDLEALVARYPDPDPTRRFDASRCIQAVFRGGGARPLILEREAGSKRRILRSRSFWDVLMAHASGAAYVDYSYRESADVYRVAITPELNQALRDAAPLLAYSTFERQIAAGAATSIDLFVKR